MSEAQELLETSQHLLEATREAHTQSLLHEATLGELVRDHRRANAEQGELFHWFVGLLCKLDQAKFEQALQRTLDDMEQAERQRWERRTA